MLGAEKRLRPVGSQKGTAPFSCYLVAKATVRLSAGDHSIGPRRAPRLAGASISGAVQGSGRKKKREPGKIHGCGHMMRLSCVQ